MTVDVGTIAIIALVQTPIIAVVTLLIARLFGRWDTRRRLYLTAAVIRKWGEGDNSSGGVEGLGFDYFLRDVGWRLGDLDFVFKGALLSLLADIRRELRPDSSRQQLGLSTKNDAKTFGKKFFGDESD